MTRYYATSDEEFIQSVKSNISIRSVLKELGMAIAGGSYASFRSRCKRLGVDTSHFLGAGWLKGKTHSGCGISMPLKDILVEESTYVSTVSLKKRLIKENLLEYKCSICYIYEWQDAALVLHIDHINGKRTDNRIENLRLLCPNCHSQTDTYNGRNKIKNPTRKHISIADINGNIINDMPYVTPFPNCKECGKTLSRKNNLNQTNLCRSCYELRRQEQPRKDKVRSSRKTSTCKDCGLPCDGRALLCKCCSRKPENRKTKIDWLPTSELLILVEDLGYAATGRKLGVSDNAIRKHIKNSKAVL